VVASELEVAVADGVEGTGFRDVGDSVERDGEREGDAGGAVVAVVADVGGGGDVGGGAGREAVGVALGGGVVDGAGEEGEENGDWGKGDLHG
jgi:hypothetical protein